MNQFANQPSSWTHPGAFSRRCSHFQSPSPQLAHDCNPDTGSISPLDGACQGREGHGSAGSQRGRAWAVQFAGLRADGRPTGPDVMKDPHAPVPCECGAAGIASGAGMKVLYVEDDEVSVRLVATVLRRRGDCELFSARTGRAGLRLAGGTRPDLVLLDLDLPDMPGETVLRGLREGPPASGVLVVVVSADARAATADRVLAAGASHVLTKPLDLAELNCWLDVAAAAVSGRAEVS